MEMIDCGWAEIAGIHAGDGYLRYNGHRKEIDISGGYDEKEYYDKHVVPLMNRALGTNGKGRAFPKRRTYGLVFYGQSAVAKFIELGFPSGKKSAIVQVPAIILESQDTAIIASFLRGYFDTDGCLTFDKKIGNPDQFQKHFNYYPRVMFITCSERLKEGLLQLMRRLGFTPRCYEMIPRKKSESRKFGIQITGKEVVIKWMEMVGSRNPSKYSRYLIWERFGFCPPNTTYDQRINILAGKIDPYSLKGL